MQEEQPTVIDNKQPIYRFKFTEDFTSILFQFAKIHQFDDRHAFKESWERWIENNNSSINNEMSRLHELGYEGDILNKMFKSARYYFRKKSTNKKDPKERRKYIHLDRVILDSMDEHIDSLDKISPADAFIDYCKQYSEEIKTEANRLHNNTDLTNEDISTKFKKTYKNRYFQIFKI